jgi:hypothetical protein
MNKKYLLKLLKELNNNISFYYWKYYNNFVLENLYNKDIYNSIIDFNWKCILNLKQLKKYYIKNKLEFIDWLENNDWIIEYSKSFWKYLNKIAF